MHAKKGTARHFDEYQHVTRHIVAHFEKELRFPVIARKSDRENAHVSGLLGSDEFGIILNGEVMRADAVAFRWGEDGRLLATAVEAKYDVPTTALHQALAYQVFFDEVYVASPQVKNGSSYYEAILSELGLGWFSVGAEGQVTTSVLPTSNTKRFNSDENSRQVLSRLIPARLFLDFPELGSPIRFGNAADGGLWVAKELGDVSLGIQINAGMTPPMEGGKPTKPMSYVGFNMEHKAGYRVLKEERADFGKVSNMLKGLVSSGYAVRLRKVHTPSNPVFPDIEIPLPDQTNVEEIWRKVNPILDRRQHEWRPHLSVGKTFLTRYDLRKEEAEEVMKKTYSELRPLVDYVKEIITRES